MRNGLHRFYCEALGGARPGEGVDLTGDEAHHLLAVRRVRAGERLALFDGRGTEGEALLVEGARAGGRAVARLRVTRIERAELPALRVTLAVSPPKGKRMALLVEKATELGAARIVPLRLARSAPGRGPGERWDRVALEAAKQCRRPLLPEIAPERDLATVLAEPSGARLLLDPSPGARPLREALPPLPGTILVLVGPEGGFTDAERAAAVAAGCVPVRLGPNVLRVETAAIAALAAISAHYA